MTAPSSADSSPTPSAAPEWALSFVDWFVPAQLKGGPADQWRQARMTVSFAWAAGVLFLIGAFGQRSVNLPLVSGLNLMSATLCLAAPLLLKRYGNLVALCHAVIGVGFIKNMGIAVLLRGPGLSGATVLVATVPLWATLLVGPRGGAVWAVLSVLGGLAILACGDSLVSVQPLHSDQRIINDHVVMVLVTVAVYAVAVLYERHRDAAQRQVDALERERRVAETELVKAETKTHVLRAERLAAVGRVAAATAHEINNPLTSVIGNLQYILQSLEPAPGHDVTAAINDAIVGAERISRVVSAMKLCGGGEHASPYPVLVADAVHLACSMSRAHTESKARVTLALEQDVTVLAELPMLALVLHNLLVNAAQAIPAEHPSQHEIRITASRHGAQVGIEVQDTGRGIPPGQLELVKEPFYTTLPLNQGLGLGLSTSEGILASYGGSLSLESRPGLTVARVTLPGAVTPGAG